MPPPAPPTATGTDPQHRRIRRVAAACLIFGAFGFAAILARTLVLQLAPPPRLEALGPTGATEHPLRGRRASLLDRHGRVLAVTRPATRLFADPALVEDPGSFAERVAYPLGYDPATLARALARRPDSRYVVIDHDLGPERLKTLRRLGWPGAMPGLATETWLVRAYPHGELAGQLLGFAGFDGDGLEGLERAFEARLQPAPGHLALRRDVRGRALRAETSRYHPPHDPAPVRLAIDAVIQAGAETILAEVLERYRAEAAQLIVMDPHTGQVLAMVNQPGFDPGHLAEARPADWRNRCVTDLFEPGSTFKPLVWAAAVEAGRARPGEPIDCTESGFYVTPRGRRLRDTRGHGVMSFAEVLVHSSNIGMAIVAQRMGHSELRRAVRRFGFGRRTGSGLPGEARGLITPPDRWNHYSQTSVPMGQEVAATPLQITRAFCALANGGLLVDPIIRAPAEGTSPPPPVYERVLSPAVADLTRRVLRQVMTEGTGRRAQSERYAMFGKSGTAQVADPEGGGYLPDRYIASFVAGAPAEDPAIVVGCFVHAPDPEIGYYGGLVAGPAVRRVVEKTLAHLGYPPEGDGGSPVAAAAEP